MKKLSPFILFIITSIASNAQCNCDFISNWGIHYVYSAKMNGVGFEVGKTGEESNFDFHANVDLFLGHRSQSGKTAATNDFHSRLYQKIGYRVLRSDYLVSVYTDLVGGLDMDMGFYGGFGLKFLHPFDRTAISIEPMYLSGKMGGWSGQAAFFFRF